MNIIRLTIKLSLFLAFSTTSLAQISPGKLSRFHVALEGISNCTKCHELGQSASPVKCLECHELLKARIDSSQGLHSTKDFRSTHCFRCHSEHHGVDFELIRWPGGQDKFDHTKTGFKLEGAHLRQECTDCHRPPFNSAVATDQHVDAERTFLGLKPACIACHEDEHRAQVGTNCLTCHNMEAWKPVPGFDHASSQYPLTGKHQKVECAKCHRPENGFAPPEGFLRRKGATNTFAWLKPISTASCASCHKDVHNGRLGAECALCHQTTSFAVIVGQAFDHSKTDYPLAGKHLTVACVKCHASANKTEKKKFAFCIDCHKDEHRGQFAARADKGACESCHTVAGFVPASYTIEQHQNSRFPLTGGHIATACAACHKPIIIGQESYSKFSFEERTCTACHQDIHKGEADRWLGLKGCEACHTTEGWTEATFDHLRAKFPLEGRHKTVNCGKCHTNEGGITGTKLTGLAMTCSGCHKDIHQGQFYADGGEGECSRCHTPAGWNWLRFNHNDARFKLDGAHARIACTGCHQKVPDGKDGQVVRYKPLGFACTDCHGKKSG